MLLPAPRHPISRPPGTSQNYDLNHGCDALEGEAQARALHSLVSP